MQRERERYIDGRNNDGPCVALPWPTPSPPKKKNIRLMKGKETEGSAYIGVLFLASIGNCGVYVKRQDSIEGN